MKKRYKEGFFVVLCGYPHKNQRGLELKIILSIENDEEPKEVYRSGTVNSKATSGMYHR
jgi:hypothetical protein